MTVAQVARLVGVSARTLRFWAEAGVVEPSGRSGGGYRLFDAEAVARVELVATLRGLGIGLDEVRRVLARNATVAEVASAHARALDAEIRVLRLRRAVLSSVARRDGTVEEMRVVHELARLSARERQRMIDGFVAEIVEGMAADAPARGIAESMRRLPADLPDDPTPEQVDAWVELAGLVGDPAFRARVREMAVAGKGAEELEHGPDHHLVVEHAGKALADGVAPESAAGREALGRIVPEDTPAEVRARILEQLELFADARVERYWQLLGALNGWPPREPAVPAFAWLIEALRAH
ncbi:MerR family transcriptional regulator [Actinocorallia herbida]|nr:MerR family transcriptional regulator [Actinocorallia herbida]